MPSPDGAPARAKRATHRVVYTPELLAELRHLYEQTPTSCESIATSHGISRPTLRLKAKREGWVRFNRPALDLSPAVKLEARLAQVEASLSLPREARGGWDRNRLAIAIPGGGSSFSKLDAAPPTPDPSPPLASLAGGGEETAAPPANSNFDHGLKHGAAAALEQALALIAALKAARQQMEETGRYSQFSQLGRDLAAITNSLYRIRRIYGGGADGALPDDDNPSDLDARRDRLARRIEIIVAEWRDAETAGQPERD